MQPKAVDKLPSNSGLLSSSRDLMYSAIFFISARTSSWLLFKFALLWVSLTDKGRHILSTPASIAFFAPLKLGTKAATVRFGRLFAYCTISAVSAICGNKSGRTNEPTSISLTPASDSAFIHFFLSSVDIIESMLWRPSLGPTSLTNISISATSSSFYLNGAFLL